MAKTPTHVCYWGKSGHETDLPPRPLVTQSRHSSWPVDAAHDEYRGGYAQQRKPAKQEYR
jgi:hypothetical protein